MQKVRIVWEGPGGELDSVVVNVKNDESIVDALITLVEGNIVNAGDLFRVEEVLT